MTPIEATAASQPSIAELNVPQSPASSDNNSKKRATSSAGLDSNGNPKPVKRRAAKACAACRARKVRCDVMQRYHVTPDGEVTCSNCTMDNIKCVIEESKRRKKHLNSSGNAAPSQEPKPVQAWGSGSGIVNPSDIENPDARRWSSDSSNNELQDDFASSHVPHSIYQNVGKQFEQADLLRRQGLFSSSYEADPTYTLLTSASITGDLSKTRLATPPAAASPPAFLKHYLPAYLKPLPQRMTSVDIDYLYAKGALSLPETPVRNALLRSYCEWVHPYMPLLELHDVLQVINDGTGHSGKISLLLYQAIMFAGTAFVDMSYLTAAGYTTRKSARKAFFQKARVLYDFDYEIDRVALVQSLLLMTYWYETPDDQKDTWHWMGVAISLAHTIGLHRNPDNSDMEPAKKKLWKRIWWSCFMRDRLIALGMRRPTRVKDEDYDVPMLTEEDFEIAALPTNITIIPTDCTLVRDVAAQRELAHMCIAKAKLCLCISHVLTAQYSVLVRHQGMQAQEGSTRSSVMLFPKKLDQTDEVTQCDDELKAWVAELPECCHYSTHVSESKSGRTLFVQRSLLHMVYYTTLSALHRPQVLPSAGASTQNDSCRELQDLSRKQVREASREITKISEILHSRNLEKYLPTTGVTVLLPAIIIHLLDIKSCNDEARNAALKGFCTCMAVLEKLRENYASADFATQFLEAAIRKADLEIMMSQQRIEKNDEATLITNGQTLQGARERSKLSALRHTPPPQNEEMRHRLDLHGSVTDHGVMIGISETSRNDITAHTPPDSDNQSTHIASTDTPSAAHEYNNNHLQINAMGAVELGNFPEANNVDLNDFFNFESANDMWNVPLDEGAHGESGGFMGDMTWIDHGPGWSRLNRPSPDVGGVLGEMTVL